MQKIIQLPLQQIQSNLEREDFSEEWLEEVAQTILDAGTLLTPLIVEHIEGKQYIVLIKDLEFFAALKASEMDASFTKISAYVVESEIELDAVEAQLQTLTGDDDVSNQDMLGILEAVLEQLAQLSESEGGVSKADIDTLKSEFSVHIFSLMQAIELNGGQFNSLFEVLGEIDHQVEQTLAKVSALTGTEIVAKPTATSTNSINPIEDFIQAVNTFPADALERKLKVLGANKVLIDNLVAAREVEQFIPFSTLDELLEVKGVGNKSLLKIVSHWNA
ncbi:hypothetical protein [Candidatus Albibeggiatoa sp. nov. BB20]|uniref:hypothetical protein n=1 Tax=Candidatus Albibeggiatoa sp. nov. BB20 TaxID=3162723 RepID=UPI0033654B0C